MQNLSVRPRSASVDIVGINAGKFLVHWIAFSAKGSLALDIVLLEYWLVLLTMQS